MNSRSEEMVMPIVGLRKWVTKEEFAESFELPKFPESLYNNANAMKVIGGMNSAQLSTFVHHLSYVLTVEDENPEAFREEAILAMNIFLSQLVK